jgi:hypothetical protein
MSKLVDSTADKTSSILLRNSTIEALKEFSDGSNKKHYDDIITELIRVFRKQMKEEQWGRDHPFTPNPDYNISRC